MKLSDLDIREKFYSNDIDGYLILGRNRDETTLKRWVVGWYSRHSPTRLARRKSFADEESARAMLDVAYQTALSPAHEKFSKDWQKHTVYLWEDIDLAGHQIELTRQEARALVAKVCDDYNIEPPELVWSQKKGSEYFPASHRIRFGHRDLISLLHELAHAIHLHTDNLSKADHSPPFVWIAIELYNRYAGVNLQYLITTAQREGLLGDIDVPAVALSSQGLTVDLNPPAARRA